MAALAHQDVTLPLRRRFSLSLTAGAGRVFFVCRRAAGNLPEGRCDFFQWEGDRQVRGSRAQAGAKSVTLKGCWN